MHNMQAQALVLLRDPAAHILDEIDKVRENDEAYTRQIPEYRGGKVEILILALPSDSTEFLEMVKFWLASLSEQEFSPIESLSI